jgi:hypothetical protein
MATVTKGKAKKLLGGGTSGAAYGNQVVFHYNMTLNSSGVLVDSDQSTAIANADVVRIGVIPGGTKLLDALICISDVGQAATTVDVGFLYVDGTDTTPAQDADYFTAALATDAQSRTAADNLAVVPVTLPKDAYVTLTIGGATHDEACVIDVIVFGSIDGIK